MQPHPSSPPHWLPTLLPASTRLQLALQDFELGLMPLGSFLRRRRIERRGRRSQRFSPCPAQAGMASIFEINWPIPRPVGCPSPLMREGRDEDAK